MVRLGVGLVGTVRLYVDDELLVDERLRAGDAALGAAFTDPPSASAEVQVTAGTPVDLRLVYDLRRRAGSGARAMSLRLGTRPGEADADALIAEAAQAAAAADVALVVVGNNPDVESEGYDRSTLALPGRQDDLVRAVVAANPHTVVLVNAGAPVLLPWRDDVAALLLGWFGGQEFGNAVAEVLLGVAEPGGRLPTTWPAAEADVPVLSCTPVDGAQEYAEGIHIGYRAWLKEGTAPAYWLGSGRGYAQIDLAGVEAPEGARAGEVVTVTVEVVNRSDRDGKQVVRVYAERADSAVDRTVRWLIGSAPVRVPAGATASVPVELHTRLLAHWADGWQYEPGGYRLRVGTSAAELPLEATLSLGV